MAQTSWLTSQSRFNLGRLSTSRGSASPPRPRATTVWPFQHDETGYRRYMDLCTARTAPRIASRLVSTIRPNGSHLNTPKFSLPRHDQWRGPHGENSRRLSALPPIWDVHVLAMASQRIDQSPPSPWHRTSNTLTPTGSGSPVPAPKARHGMASYFYPMRVIYGY